MKKIRKVTRRVHKTSFFGIGVGIAYELWPNLQGILPTWWYLGVFGAILVLHALKSGDDHG